MLIYQNNLRKKELPCGSSFNVLKDSIKNDSVVTNHYRRNKYNMN